jgi:hypothetical protein
MQEFSPMFATLRAPILLALGTFALAGCANTPDIFGSADLTTSSVQATAAPKVDPACVALASQIDGLRKDGVADKIEKAAAKKYKMTPVDLTKADQLTKANADFQARCAPNVRQAGAAPSGQTASLGAPVTAISKAQ